jgi:DNA-binding PadR family transcriptional regulator
MSSVRHLTAFQRDILYIISDLDTPYGLGIKEALEGYYDEDVNTGRVYQNLAKLTDEGYIEKSAIDKRTNAYTLTQKAFRAIEHRHNWQMDRAEEQLAD